MIIWRPFVCQMCKIVEKCLILETRTCMFDNEWQEPPNRFAPNSYRRRVWSFSGMSLNVKVKGHGHQGQKTHRALTAPLRCEQNGTPSLQITSHRQHFRLIIVELQPLGRHPVADVQDALLKLVDGWRSFIATEVQVQLCVISISMNTCHTWRPRPQGPPCTKWKTLDQGLSLVEPST